MAWRIELSGLAQKNLRSLDKQAATRILHFLQDRLAQLEDPRSLGEALKGTKLGEFWKYRVGDYRIIADLQDQELVFWWYASAIGARSTSGEKSKYQQSSETDWERVDASSDDETDYSEIPELAEAFFTTAILVC